MGVHPHPRTKYGAGSDPVERRSRKEEPQRLPRNWYLGEGISRNDILFQGFGGFTLTHNPSPINGEGKLERQLVGYKKISYAILNNLYLYFKIGAFIKKS